MYMQCMYVVVVLVTFNKLCSLRSRVSVYVGVCGREDGPASFTHQTHNCGYKYVYYIEGRNFSTTNCRGGNISICTRYFSANAPYSFVRLYLF